MNQRVTNTERADDVGALKALIEQHEATIAAQQSELASLHEQLRLLLARRFGASSERAADAQLGLFNEAEQDAQGSDNDDDEDEPSSEAESIEVPAHARTRPKRKPLSKELPRVSVVHDLAEADKVCPHDGTALEFDVPPLQIDL